MTKSVTRLAQQRVVVTGLGLVSPVGTGVSRVWERLLAGASGIRALKPTDLPESHRPSFKQLRTKVAGLVNTQEFLDYDWARQPDVRWKLPHDQTVASVFAATAAAEAMLDAQLSGVGKQQPLTSRAGVALGVGLPSVWQGGRAGQIVGQGRPDQLPEQLLSRLLLGSPSVLVAAAHHLQGPVKTHTTACSAGAHAIGDAWRHIRDGDADIMLAGGAESCIDAITIAGFANMRAMSTDTFWQPGELSRPFDNARSGFVMGEGAAVLVLENMDHAQARGARMYAEVRSCGMTGDAHHAVQPDPGGYGALTAMRSALALGGVAPEQVKYLNAHAASTPLGDALEQLAISKAFGEWATGGRARERLQVSSTKGATGHLLGAAGAIEAVFSVLALAHRLAPPTLNLAKQEPRTLRGIVGPKGPAQLPSGPIAVMSNSFGFGGTNAALLLTSPPQVDDW